jgi:peptidase M23-like protein
VRAMTTSLAHIAWRPVLGVALALALAGVVCADTMLASARSTTTPVAISTVEIVPSAARNAAPARVTPSRYGWPVKPFRRQHAVRGFFGDPRISNHHQTRQFHFGVDVSAPNGTPVFATLTGRVWISGRHPHTVEIVGGGGYGFSYWHVIPAVRSGERAVAYRTLIGHVEAPYGHVHFSEARNGRYLNPLRLGAMGPFVDHTTPWVARLTAENDDRLLQSSSVHSAFDLVAEVDDETPLAIPRPWHDLPVTPAVTRWRLVTAHGRAVLGWRTAADFRETIPSAAEFDRVWAPGTTQNHVRSPGHYRLFLARGLELPTGRYVVEVAVRDTRGNHSASRFPLVVRSR